ncbi:MAG: radical SAM protein [Bacteroidales bacterium]|nr:radical SAM protein [Bacteroidales bacterium]
MVDEKYIPINKGHFELDTLERHDEFQMKMSFGWEEEYKEYRRLWEVLPKQRKIRDYPLLVDLEMSSVCNLHCPMCPTVSEEFQKRIKKQFLDMGLLRKVIDEVAGNVFAIRLSLVGEPTLHKQLADAISYAKSKGIKEISFLTNGSLLTEEYFAQLVVAGVDWITISIDGLDETYESIRKPLKFKDTLNTLKMIKSYKEKRGLLKPVIKVQGVWPSIRPNPTKYYDTISPLVDLVAYNPLIDYLHKDMDIVYEKNFLCSQLYQRLVISSDGMVKLCSNDEYREVILGDANAQTVHEIWHSKKLNEIREIHNQPDGFKTMHVCRACYYPRKTVPDERAMVGDREIWIENYVNRKQEVGK